MRSVLAALLLLLGCGLAVPAQTPAPVSRLVVLHWYAPWCGPCKAMHPDLSRFEQDYADRATVVELDIDRRDDANLALYKPLKRTRVIPETAMLRDGVLVFDRIGRMDEQALKDAADAALAAAAPVPLPSPSPDGVEGQ